MIDKFKAKFVEESNDNVHDLEEALLLLEKDTGNKEIVERIFRAMHTLKGGGAMFGFNQLSEFTHHLETVFDLVRNNKLEITDDIISLTFESIDHIKHMLEVGDVDDEEELDNQQSFIQRVQRVANLEGAVVTKTPASKEVAVKDDGSKTYLIDIKPNEEILRNGTNPFYLLDDLHAMGIAKVVAYHEKVPVLSSFNPISNYCHWQVVLNTSESINDIKDVFIFVEDECDIAINEISAGNLLTSTELVNKIDEAARLQKPLVKDELAGLAASTSDSEAKKDARKKVQLKEHKISSIRVNSSKIDELVNLVSELVTIQAQLNLFAENDGNPAVLALAENIQKLSRQLRDNAFSISLIPLQSELMRFQRLVRDLSKELQKDIDFVIEGGDIELDKNIIEHLTDPLLHIIRNAVDHGIELPDERIGNGKSPKGTILFKAYYSGASVIVKVMDDGKGIDPEFIRNKAISKGLIDSSTELSRKEIFELVFLSGFSTKDEVTDVSGRGVGMDVVKKKIGEIRGEVSLDSEIGKGTTLTLELPMTLSIIDGLLVRVFNNQYVIPIANIEKIYAIDSVSFGKTFNHVVNIDSEQYPFIDLRETFETDLVNKGTEQLILVKYEDRKVGLLVDQVIGEFQTVVKPMGRFLKKQENISGASIMGDGTIAMVIDTNRLIHNNATKKYRTKN
ncbi:chemotaxis protein CheA [Carboxylicivirga mesophila]|uniref:Chemotaxis protein CheA n=1 Tax=Carboxylicivirga mesophila TaxID=1166478 RepID=A0ABS5KE01_9BACT|nr:chemotaxis protein CheA [Carboxylicivirga mesophila]MBS2213032.1 chemotaxis protein CheA [Carboxylicivirga mesophila]